MKWELNKQRKLVVALHGDDWHSSQVFILCSGDWLLHLQITCVMLQYFAAVGTICKSTYHYIYKKWYNLFTTDLIIAPEPKKLDKAKTSVVHQRPCYTFGFSYVSKYFFVRGFLCFDATSTVYRIGNYQPWRSRRWLLMITWMTTWNPCSTHID